MVEFYSKIRSYFQVRRQTPVMIRRNSVKGSKECLKQLEIREKQEISLRCVTSET